MRWHDVPWMEGYTDPLGTISSPYAGLGITGPLRLAPGQPPLVGEDLGNITSAPPPDKPPPAPPPQPGPGPIGPGPGPGPGGGGAPGPVIGPFIASGSGFAESQENRPIRRSGFGPPPYGELGGARRLSTTQIINMINRWRRRSSGNYIGGSPQLRSIARRYPNKMRRALVALRLPPNMFSPRLPGSGRPQAPLPGGMRRRFRSVRRRAFGELVPSDIQADANFSTSPLELGPSSSMSKQGWGDLGAHLIAADHYGGYGASEVLVEQRSSAPAAIASVLSTLRNVGKNAGLDTAAAISVREGIPVSEAALEVISTSKLGAEDIKRRIAKLEAAAATAKAKRQRSRYKKYRVRIAALRARLRDVEKGRVQAVRDVPTVAGDKSRIPPWVTWAGLGLGAASLLVALVSMGKGKKK